MQAIVDQGHLPGTGATIAFDMGYPSMAPTQGNRALLTRLNDNLNGADTAMPAAPDRARE